MPWKTPYIALFPVIDNNQSRWGTWTSYFLHSLL